MGVMPIVFPFKVKLDSVSYKENTNIDWDEPVFKELEGNFIGEANIVLTLLGRKQTPPRTHVLMKRKATFELEEDAVLYRMKMK